MKRFLFAAVAVALTALPATACPWLRCKPARLCQSQVSYYQPAPAQPTTVRHTTHCVFPNTPVIATYPSLPPIIWPVCPNGNCPTGR